MYNEIIDPKTGKKVSMSTQEGKIILLNYLKMNDKNHFWATQKPLLGYELVFKLAFISKKIRN